MTTLCLITHRMGGMESVSLEALPALYDELNGEDDEHPDVSVKNGDWALSAFGDGLLIWGDVEAGDDERHMKNVSREKVLELWRKLAVGDFDAINAEPWLPGYGNDRGASSEVAES